MATNAERLQLVRDAIDEILSTGQSLRYGERQLTKADLRMLSELEDKYKAQVIIDARAASGARNKVVYVVPR